MLTYLIICLVLGFWVQVKRARRAALWPCRRAPISWLVTSFAFMVTPLIGLFAGLLVFALLGLIGTAYFSSVVYKGLCDIGDFLLEGRWPFSSR